MNEVTDIDEYKRNIDLFNKVENGIIDFNSLALDDKREVNKIYANKIKLLARTYEQLKPLQQEYEALQKEYNELLEQAKEEGVIINEK